MIPQSWVAPSKTVCNDDDDNDDDDDDDDGDDDHENQDVDMATKMDEFESQLLSRQS